MTGILPKDIRRCAHRKTNGIPCGSPALKDKPYCYFHDRWREQHIDVLDGTPYYQSVEAELPILEDANSIQMALTKVFHMLLAGLLDPKFARSLTYCLSIAAQNLPRCNFAPKDEELGDNEPARADQSIGQSAYPTVPRPEKDEWNMSPREKEDAAIAAKKAAGSESNPEETLDLKAAAGEDLKGRGFSSAARVRLPRLRALARLPRPPRFSKGEKAGIVDLMAIDHKKIKLNLPKPYKNPPGFRGPITKNEEANKPEPKPAVNLFDRLAERREEYKKREGIM